MATHYPLGRQDVLVQEIDGEVLIYDLSNDKVSCLNETAGSIWKLCDGKRTTADIRDILAQTYDSEAVGESFVWLALDQLKRENLLENHSSIPDSFDGLSRRDIIKRIGMASMIALPLISSVIAPTSANAQSVCLAKGTLSAGTFPQAGGFNSEDCIDALAAMCCSMGVNPAGCGCTGNPIPNTCVGSGTCL